MATLAFKELRSGKKFFMKIFKLSQNEIVYHFDEFKPVAQLKCLKWVT